MVTLTSYLVLIKKSVFEKSSNFTSTSTTTSTSSGSYSNFRISWYSTSTFR